MIRTTCSKCSSTGIPTNETINIDGDVFCAPCLDSEFPDQKGLAGKAIKKIHDPTICSACSKDFGDTELKKLGVYPHCTECEKNAKNRAFPTWVKLFLAGIAAIIVFSFFWNWRYYAAYSDLNAATLSFRKGDYSNAAALMKRSSGEVPEVADLATLAAYYNGITLLQKNKPDSAMAEFEKCKDILPADFGVNGLIIQSKISKTFNNKDYDGFLAAAKQHFAEIDSTSSDAYSGLGSAYACIYAQKGNEAAKTLALQNIAKAKSIDSTSADSKFYYNFLAYRIDSRQIITREAFIKKFPNGWTKK